MAAGWAHRLDGRILGKELYDGKLDRPSLFRRALGAEELEQLRQGASPLKVGRADLVAAWDFSKEMRTSRVRDLGPNKLHATALNMPARAVTGHNWSGRESDFRRSPGEYGAIHFHSDDRGCGLADRFHPDGSPKPQERYLSRPGSEAPIGKTTSLSSSGPGREPGGRRRPCWSPP